MINDCKNCNGKGFVDSSYLVEGIKYNSLLQCRVCNDIQGYSQEVAKRIANMKTYDPDEESYQEPKKRHLQLVKENEEVVNNVLPFRR